MAVSVLQSCRTENHPQPSSNETIVSQVACRTHNHRARRCIAVRHAKGAP